MIGTVVVGGSDCDVVAIPTVVTLRSDELALEVSNPDDVTLPTATVPVLVVSVEELDPDVIYMFVVDG